MATVVLAPTNNGSTMSWSVLVGAASKWEACLTNDGDTSYSGATWVDGTEVLGLFGMDNLPSTVAKVTDVTVTVIVRRNNASLANIRPALKLSGGSVQYSGSNFTSSTSYVTISYSFGSFTIAEVNGMECGAELGTNFWSTFCTQVYATVTYIPVAVYPTDPLVRVSGITRTFRAWDKTYQVVLNLGSNMTNYVSPISGKIQSAIEPAVLPSGPGYTRADYEKWLAGGSALAKRFPQIPYEVWLKVMGQKQAPLFGPGY